MKNLRKYDSQVFPSHPSHWPHVLVYSWGISASHFATHLHASEYKILQLSIMNAAGITKVYTSKYNSAFSNFCSSFFLTQQQTSCDKLWELHWSHVFYVASHTHSPVMGQRHPGEPSGLCFHGCPPMSCCHACIVCFVYPRNNSFLVIACSHWSDHCWMDVATLLSSERKNVQTTTVSDTQRLRLPETLCQAPIRQPCVLHSNNGCVGGYSKSQPFPYTIKTKRTLLSWWPVF